MENLQPNTSMPQAPIGKMASGSKSNKNWVYWVVVLLVILGAAAYWWLASDILNAPTAGNSTEDQATAGLEQQSSSDDVNSIEADLNATNLNDLDKEFGDIEASF